MQHFNKSNFDKLIDALLIGTITAIGGSVYDKQMNYVCSTSDLPVMRDKLREHNIVLHRIDAGGNPTWSVKDASTVG